MTTRAPRTAPSPPNVCLDSWTSAYQAIDDEMMRTVDNLDPLERLVAEAEIRRVIARYCRGIDRMDLELVRSCYHDDAHDEHGSFSGTVDEYLAWVRPLLEKYDATMHFVGNQLVDFDDADTAWVETYGMSVHRSASDAPHLNLTTGFRFVDRFERRGDEWRIAGGSPCPTGRSATAPTTGGRCPSTTGSAKRGRRGTRSTNATRAPADVPRTTLRRPGSPSCSAVAGARTRSEAPRVR